MYVLVACVGRVRTYVCPNIYKYIREYLLRWKAQYS
jgi:hypothetical protein